MSLSDAKYTLVYIPDEQVFGIVINYGAFVSKVRYYMQGVQFDVDMENTEFIIWREPLFSYED